jgi:hypothetical protein
VALVERAVQMTSLKEMSLAKRISVHGYRDFGKDYLQVTTKLVQQGESLK